MLNHTYTSVKNANLVDGGKKQHIPSQPSPLLKDNFLGEFRTELDKKKVLANLGIATSLSLEWEYIKGDIGRSETLMKELDSRTKYVSEIDGFQKSIIDGIKYLETVIGGEEEGEAVQDERILALETLTNELVVDLEEVKDYLTDTIEVDINTLEESLEAITEKVNNITDLIQVSSKAGNALRLVGEEELEEGETPGLYVPDLSEEVSKATEDIETLREDIGTIQESLETFVTKEELGGGDFDFVNQDDFDTYTEATADEIADIKEDLKNTVKTGEDGHVDTLYVNKISKNNDDGNIKVTDSFEVESGIPLDIRAVVENLDELCALPAKVCYAGMGVIVNSISSLYILRKPAEGTRIDQDYIGNIYNWKCPEDLVTVALSREEYEKLEEVNPNVFYYVYEEEIKRTQEPKPEEFGSTEEYEKAFADWVDSLKTLSQEYMSASWGVDIENKLGKKANQVAVNALNDNIKGLQEQINALSGGDSENSLSALAERLTTAESELDFLLGTEGTDEEPSSQGKITEIEESIVSLDEKVTEQYVSKESITNENDTTNYIFVKKSDYTKDVNDRAEALGKEVITESLKADLTETDQITLSELPITSNGTDLLVNSEEVALVKDVPKMIYLSQAEYDAIPPEEIDPDTYYYTTDEEIYVTKTDFDTKVTQINTSISAANTSILEQKETIQTLQTKIEELLATIETLQERIEVLEGVEENPPIEETE
jgi:hypothetical protein